MTDDNADWKPHTLSLIAFILPYFDTLFLTLQKKKKICCRFSVLQFFNFAPYQLLQEKSKNTNYHSCNRTIKSDLDSVFCQIRTTTWTTQISMVLFSQSVLLLLIVFSFKKGFATEQEVKVKTDDTSAELKRAWPQCGCAWMIVNSEKAHQDWSQAKTQAHMHRHTSAHTYTDISSLLHNTVSDGSWGHNNTAFGICPVKVGQRGNGVSGRKQRGTGRHKSDRETEKGSEGERDKDRNKERFLYYRCP